MIDANETTSMPEPDGEELLSSLYNTLKTYVTFANDDQVVAVALWIGASHAIPAWNHATRLVIFSPQKRCGKSRLLDVVALLSHNLLMSANATTPAIYRSIGNDDFNTPTIFFDEADDLFSSKRTAEQNEDLRAFINAGWQRDRSVLRCVGPQQIPTEFNTFAMLALAAIGQLPDTITDRAINIGLKRRRPGEHVSQFRARRDGGVLGVLRGQLSTWVRNEDRMRALTDAEPELPVEDRAADVWEPLVAIADAAGGEWPRRARAACVALVSAADSVDESQSTPIRLLTDIRQVFADKIQPFLSSADLVIALHDLKDSPWDDFKLTQNSLAYRLRDYGIAPRRDRTGDVRGYRLEDLTDVFERYLRDSSDAPSDGVRPSEISSELRRSSDDSKSSDDLDRQTQNGASDNPPRPALISDGLTVSDGHTRAESSQPHRSDQSAPLPDGLMVADGGRASEHLATNGQGPQQTDSRCSSCDERGAEVNVGKRNQRCQPCQDAIDRELAQFMERMKKGFRAIS
jgi:hypothetical protein